MGQTAIWLISTKMLKLILWWLLLCCMLWHPSPWKSMLKSPSMVSRFPSARTSRKDLVYMWEHMVGSRPSQKEGVYSFQIGRNHRGTTKESASILIGCVDWNHLVFHKEIDFKLLYLKFWNTN